MLLWKMIIGIYQMNSYAKNYNFILSKYKYINKKVIIFIAFLFFYFMKGVIENNMTGKEIEKIKSEIPQFKNGIPCKLTSTQELLHKELDCREMINSCLC